MKIGTDGTYTLVGSELSDYKVQEDGEIAFFYNDDSENNYFADNSGSFSITLTKE